MLRVNARHRAAHANSRRHEFDNFPLWLEFFGDSLHQIELGADKPASVRRGGGDGFNDVFREPTSSDRAHTSSQHSGWEITKPSGCFSRKARMCSGRNIWCTEQKPFHRIILARRISSFVNPPCGWSKSHTAISSGVMPIVRAVHLPKCWSGKKSVFSFLS